MDKDTLYVKRKRPTDILLLTAIYISATLAVALFCWELSCMSL